METLNQLLQQNKQWAADMVEADPRFFERLQDQQSPDLLWIGCSDSRVPANQIAGVLPGSIFVHRNVANVVNHQDKNCLAVVQFGVQVLKIGHLLVVGHYHCGGVGAVLQHRELGLVSEWLRPMEAVRDRFSPALNAMPEDARWDALCELNVIDQARSLAQTSIVQEAWSAGQELCIHGWIYGVHDGRLRDLGVTVSKPEELAETVEQCFASVVERWRTPQNAARA